MLRLSFEVSFGWERREASERVYTGNIFGTTVCQTALAGRFCFGYMNPFTPIS